MKGIGQSPGDSTDKKKQNEKIQQQDTKIQQQQPLHSIKKKTCK